MDESTICHALGSLSGDLSRLTRHLRPRKNAALEAIAEFLRLGRDLNPRQAAEIREPARNRRGGDDGEVYNTPAS